ncbi:MAG TPA: flagellar hook protein FlgE [Stellaceae bacterium]|jgi:flagellar hook protein FlgE|nr:flagellar hook protein FlgE [Stellaceae bacterium]
MSLLVSLSGVQAAQTDIDTIGNNIANVSTAGFKESDAEFADIYSGARSGLGGSIDPGLGVNTNGLPQSFAEGTITQTGNPLDMAIDGNGFFQVETGSGIAFSRDGQFHLDNSGNLVTTTGNQVMGFAATGSDSTATPAGTLVPITVSTASVPATPTSAVSLAINLPSSDPTIDPTTTPFNPSNRASYDESTSFSVFDSLGVSRTLTTYFTQTQSGAGANSQWQTNYQLADANGNVDASGTGPTLTFDSSGKLVSGNGTITASNLPNGAAPLNIAEDFTGSTLSGLAFGVNSINDNGSAAGQFAGVSVSSDGSVVAQYDNGDTRNFGTVALANFANPQGLTPISGNLWLASSASGTALTGAPSSAGLGVLQSGAVEGSNVDLSTQLVNLIGAQQAYQANVQGINIEQQDIQRLLTIQ